jgi:ParB family chromosome partitioning protein
MSKEHSLKIWPSYFDAIKSGAKTFEYRKNDRDFAVGDVLLLQEYDPIRGVSVPGLGYTGRRLTAKITYVAQGVFGIPDGYCVMSIADVAEAP